RSRHTRFSRDWSSDVCSSDLGKGGLKMLRVGGITMLCSIASVSAFSHSAVHATHFAAHWQNQVTVRGTVKDISTGQPLAGVTVRSEERRVGKESGCRRMRYEQ